MNLMRPYTSRHQTIIALPSAVAGGYRRRRLSRPTPPCTRLNKEPPSFCSITRMRHRPYIRWSTLARSLPRNTTSGPLQCTST